MIVGPNASGKTNLLEALHIALTGGSYRMNTLAECIHFQFDFAQIQLLLESSDAWQETIAIQIKENSKKIILNDKTVQSLTGLFPLVTWMPEDLDIIRAGPKYRRQFLDHILSIQDPLYLYHSKRLAGALKQKNTALKLKHFSSIDAINPEVASASIYLSAARLRLMKALQEPFCSAMQQLRFGNEHELRIKSHCLVSFEEMLHALKRVKPQEVMSKSTLKGAHLDDMEILLGGVSARRFASLGQSRALVAALKIAQVRLLGDLTPLLLIDEVGMGLDKERMEAVWELMGGWQQAVVTTPDLGKANIHSLMGEFNKITLPLP